MNYIAGPIVLSPDESRSLLLAFLEFCLVLLLLTALFLFSFIKTLRSPKKKAQISGGKKETDLRFAFTIKLPLLTVFSFIAWLVASIATKSSRVNGFYLSDALAYITFLLFLASIICAVYYAFKKR